MESKASKTDKTLVPLFGTEEWVEYTIALLPGMTIDEQLYTERQIVKAVAIIEQRKTIMKGGPEAEQLKRELEKINRRDKETLQSLRLMRREDELKAKKLKEQPAINLLKRDTSPDYIAEIFGLSIDEVMEIKANLDG